MSNETPSSPPGVSYGLLGASGIARACHIPAIRNVENSRLLGVSSRRASKAAEWARDLEIPKAYTSYEEMLDDPDIDAVLNTLPMSLHCEWIVKACEAGKHTLCEKPMAIEIADAHRIREAAEAHGVLVMEGFTHRFQPHLPAIRKILRSGELGEIRIVRAEVIYTTSDWENDSRARVDLGGCVTVEAGCYATNTIRYFMEDEPTEAQGYAVQRADDGLDTSFVGLMRFPGKRLGLMYTSMETAFRSSAEIVCTAGRIEIPDLFRSPRIDIINLDRERREMTWNPRNRFETQLEHFSDCILHGREPEVTLEDSLRNTEILVKLRESDKPPA